MAAHFYGSVTQSVTDGIGDGNDHELDDTS